MTDTPPLAADLSAAADLDDDGLSTQQRLFADTALEMIAGGDKKWRAEAARRAGYSDAPNAAFRLIRNAKVVSYMARKMTEAAEEVHVDRKFILFRALANLTACEATGDYRTAHRYLDTIGKHIDVGAFVRGADGDKPAPGGMIASQFDPTKLSTDELATMVGLMRKAAGGQPTE